MRAALWTGMFSRHHSKPEKIVEELRNCGFQVAELSETELGRLISDENPSEHAKEFRNFCDKIGLELSQAHLPNILTAQTATELDILLTRLEISFKIMNILNVSVAVIHPIKAGTIIENIQAEAMDINKAFFKQAVILAKNHNISLAIENLIGVTCVEYQTLIDSVPGLGLNLDTAHASSSAWDIPKAIKEFGPKLIGLHLSDNNGQDYDLHLTPGKGDLDWTTIIAKLKEIDYQGDFHMELPHERDDDLHKTREAAKIALKTAKEMLYI